MKQLYQPFVQGIQDADADSSDMQSGKLADACNVHVHPERANILSLRPGFIWSIACDTNARMCVAGGRVAYVGEDDFGRLGDDNTFFQDTSDALLFRNFAVTATETFASRQRDAIWATAYAEQTNGDRMVLISFDNGAGGFSVYYQRVANGRRFAEEAWTTTGTNLARVFVFPRNGTPAGYSSLVNSASGGQIQMKVSTTNAGTFGSNIPLNGTVLLDAVQNSNGTISYIHKTGSAGIVFRRIDETTGSTVEGPFTVESKLDPTVAGIARISDTVWHVWAADFPSESSNLYCYRVTSGGTIALLTTYSAPLSPTNPRVIAVGGGSLKTGPSTNGVGSYCYLSGGGGDDPRVGRLFFHDNVSTTTSTYTAPILPMGRLWCDTTFFGARIWGLQQKIGGCWELANSGETTTNAAVRTRPICYHTVTRGTATPLSVGTEANRQFCVYNGTNTSKAILFGRDSSAVTLVTLGYNLPTRGTTVNNSKFDVLIGAVPRYWDGVGFVPCGIPQAPFISSATPSATGSLAAGTYIYTMVWEWNDAAGNRQQSGAQLATVVVPASGNVALEIHPASIPYDERIVGAKPGLRGVVYRTDPGGTTLKRGALYLEFTTFGPSAGLYGATQFLVQDNGTVSFTTGEALYMSPGGANELAATALEESYLMRPYSDRMVGVSKSFPDQLWYTKTIQVARGIEPNQALYFRFPEIATGLAVQDGNVYWFSERNCYAFVPQFADDTGQGGGGVDSVPLAPGVGCEAPNSIVETPVGVFFIGPRGPWAIPRGGGAPQFIGADVEEFFRLFPTCRGAVYNADFSEVVFAMEGATRHCLIIYNHVAQVWYRWMIGDDSLTSSSNALMPTIGQGIAYADGKLVVAGQSNGAGSIMLTSTDSSSVDDAFLASTRTVHSYVETKNYYPSGGPGEMYRANRVALDCNAESSAKTITVSSSSDDGATWATSFALPVIAGYPPIYRFPVQKTRGSRVRFYTTWNSQTNPVNQDHAPLKLNGATLYYHPLGRAKSASPQYRG